MATNERFTRFMNDEDLLQLAIKMLPSQQDKRVFVGIIGTGLLERFDRTGYMGDLEKAIVLVEQVVKSTPSDHPDHAMYLNNLRNALQSQFERTGSMEDLNRAIETNEQAVKSTPSDYSDHAMYLDSFEIALQSRFERTGSMEDLSHVIETNEQAVKTQIQPKRSSQLCRGA